MLQRKTERCAGEPKREVAIFTPSKKRAMGNNINQSTNYIWYAASAFYAVEAREDKQQDLLPQ